MSQSPMFCLTFHFLNSVLVSAAVLTSAIGGQQPGHHSSGLLRPSS